jgi:integrase
MARKARKKSLTHRWRDENGVHRRRTFRTSSEKTAFVWQLDEERRNPKDQSIAVTFDEACERYLEQHAKLTKRPAAYRGDKALINRYLKSAFADRLLNDLDERSLEEFRSKMQVRRVGNRQISPRTVNSVLILAKAIMRRAHRWKLVDSHRWYEVKLLKQQEPEFDFWTVDERNKFLAWLQRKDADLWRVATVAVYTGLRKSELWALRRGAVDLEGRLLRVMATTDHSTGVRSELTKNGRSGAVPLAQPAYEALTHCRLYQPDEPVFDQALFWNLSKRFRKICRDADVREIRFHDLRHTFASHLVQAGVPIYEVQKLMRHQSIKMTERYAKLRMDKLTKAVDKLLFKKKAPEAGDRACAPQCAPGAKLALVKSGN